MLRLTVVLVVLLPAIAVGQSGLFGASLDPNIPAPRSILGYELGERFSDHRAIESYVKAVAASSDRVQLTVYGETYEHRPLMALTVTSPANLRRLEAIRSKNLALTMPGGSAAAAATADLPGIVWFSFGIHGNESSSPEAAMAILYQLAAGQDERTLKFLDSLVVIIDPSLNPDGRERYVRWVNGVSQNPPNEDLAAYEHNEPWPGGRTNHYYFDLNRDWSWLTQRETQQRAALYLQWMPHTHVDFHEMGYDQTYFFFPATKPFHESLPPSVLTWGERYGRGNARALEQAGSRYFVRENFDMFYPGYGDSWPTFNGSIGMTYEQAGSGRAGLIIRRPDNTTLRLIDRIRNHFTTGMATLETTVQFRAERIRDFATFFAESQRSARAKRFIAVPSTEDPTLTSKLAEVLTRQGIDVFRLASSRTLSSKAFFTSRTANTLFPEGSIVVPLDQPRGFLATAILEPRTALKDTFFYDVSAWSLPVAYGLEAHEVAGEMPQNVERATVPVPSTGVLSGPPNAYAYLIPTTHQGSYALLSSALRSGISAHVAQKSFSIEGTHYRPGTAVIFRDRNDGALRDSLTTLAKQTGVTVTGVASGWTDKGVSLGSESVQSMRSPRVAIATGDGVSPGNYGELWYLFEQELHLPFTAIDAVRLGSADIDRYDVIVLPDGWRWSTVLDSTFTQTLKRWVERGGTLIAMQEAGRTLARQKSGLAPALLVTDDVKDEAAKKKRDEERRERLSAMSQFERDEYHRLAWIPGAIFRVSVDTTHPLGFGSKGYLYAFKGNAVPFSPKADDGHTVARFAPDSVALSGYVSAERGKQVAGSAYARVYQRGLGSVVLFGEPLTFRMFWRGPTRLFLNAVFFLPKPERLVGGTIR